MSDVYPDIPVCDLLVKTAVLQSQAIASHSCKVHVYSLCALMG